MTTAEMRGPSGLGQRIDAELELLARGEVGLWILYAVVVALVALGLIGALRRAQGLLRERYGDEEAWPDRLRTAIEVGILVAATGIALRPLISRAPLVVGVLLVVGAFIASRVATPWTRSLLAGLSLSRRRTFREGDVISVGGRRGMVEGIGLFRTVLVSEDGTRRSIPNRIVTGEEITIAATGGVSRIRIEVELPFAVAREQLERVRRALLASPFRRPGSVVSVSAGSGPSISAELEIWASDQGEEIERRLARRVAAVSVPQGGASSSAQESS